MQFNGLNLKIMGIVQTTGALVGILSAVIFPDGGHPSLAVLVGLVVIPLNLFLALVQIVTRLFFFTGTLRGGALAGDAYWRYLAAGWFSTIVFVSWQWPPLFF